MRNRRRSRPATRGSWTPERSKRAHEAKARLRIDRAESGLTHSEPQRVPEGQHLGVLTWHAADGTVRSWIINQGPRANNIGVVARLLGSDGARRVMGWDKLLSSLRKRLALPKRLFNS